MLCFIRNLITSSLGYSLNILSQGSYYSNALSLLANYSRSNYIKQTPTYRNTYSSHSTRQLLTPYSNSSCVLFLAAYSRSYSYRRSALLSSNSFKPIALALLLSSSNNNSSNSDLSLSNKDRANNNLLRSDSHKPNPSISALPLIPYSFCDPNIEPLFYIKP